MHPSFVLCRAPWTRSRERSGRGPTGAAMTNSKWRTRPWRNWTGMGKKSQPTSDGTEAPPPTSEKAPLPTPEKAPPTTSEKAPPTTLEKAPLPIPQKAPPSTFEAIIAEHGKVIRRYVTRQGFRGADRDDLVQEIFHGAARSLPRFDPRLGNMRTWLLRIAFNLISNERKRAHRRHEELWPVEALDGISSGALDSETRLMAAQRRDFLTGLLRDVPQTRREILIAHDLEGESIQQIAEQRAMPPNTAWNHLRLARQRLKDAERRFRARHRGRGVLFAWLAAVFGATEARASESPLQRALRHLRRPLAAAAGVVAGALVLLAPGDGGDALSSQACVPHAGACAVAVRAPHATPTDRREQAASSVTDAPPEAPAAVEAAFALSAAAHAPPNRRPPPEAPREHAAARLPEHRLMRQAIATLAAGRDRAAQRLLERHRREFPRGVYARDREDLLRRLSPSAQGE